MAILPVQLARVSNQLQTSVSLSSIAKTQQNLLEVQNELSTGKRVNSPSDDPGAAAIIQQLQKTLEARDGFSTNLKYASAQLGQVDSTLGDITNLMQQASDLASANVGSDTTDDQRKGAAAVATTIINQVLSLANTQSQGVYIFAGDRSTAAPFTDANGSIKYVGSSDTLSTQVDENSALPFQINGAQLFGALTTQVQGATDLAPQIVSTTRLEDLKGSTGDGIAKGSIRVGNGSTTVDVDLSSADTLGDVVNKINAAGLSGVTATFGLTGIVLTGSGNISVNEVGGGTTANDLGILRPAGAGAGLPVGTQNLGPQVTPLTTVGDLRAGLGIDTAGLTITNGGVTTNISLTGAATVEDVLNKINYSKAGVLARINSAGTGIDIVNPTQGTSFTISENGGTTAADLGLQSFTAATNLKDLNGGLGVRTVTGADLQINRKDGTSFSVDVDGLNTVNDVISAINAADGGNGVTASFSANGTGIVLTDSTGGGSAFSVTPLNASTAANDLGLTTAAAGNTINGANVNPVVSTGIFANLEKLRDALQSSDQAGITAAATGIKSDLDRVITTRGEASAQVQDLQNRQSRLDDENVATKSFLSDLQDTDMTTAITKFQQLQTALQANYQTTAKMLHMSLLDFLA